MLDKDRLRLINTLIVEQRKRKEFLESFPEGFPTDSIFDNTYVDSLNKMYETLVKEVFGQAIFNDIMWYIYEWRPGYEITYPTKNPGWAIKYQINNEHDFIDYLKTHYFK